jgi:predicted sulfurtransferase
MEKIILFYKYVSIAYPKQILKWQTKLCAELGFTGRIILAHEGINGTLAGTVDSIELYKKLMLQHQLFGDIDFKESDGVSSCFPRMQIKIKSEIVNLGIDSTKLTAQEGGVHLKPAAVHELLQKKPQDVVLFDARNKYESAIGAFEGAIKPDISYFRQLPGYIDEHMELFKDKQVVMYCTGGVRCERATAYLKQKGIAKTVYQVEGGIHRYLEQFPDGFFRGKNYVFDSRIAVATNDDITSTCLLCAVPCAQYTNCLNASCNKHFVCCENCNKIFNKTCSQECKTLVLTGSVPLRPEFKRVKV